MESYLSLVSLGGAAFSTLSTFYFWLVRANRERPNLRPYAIDREFFLGASNAQTRQIGFKLGLVVANYSSLPNALIGAKVALQGKEGKWIDVGALAFDKQTPMPFNLPPLHTVLLRLTGTLSFPYSDALEQGNKAVSAYLQQTLAEPRRVRVELHHLNDRKNSYEIALPETPTVS